MADPRAKEGATLTLDAPEAGGTAQPGTLYVEAIRQALREEMERDGRVFVIGEDVGAFGGAFKATEGLFSRFGAGRVIDTPVSEEAIVGAAIGAAMRGLRPVAEMQFMDFISRAFDLLTNYAAKSRYRTGVGVPLVVRGPSGAGVHGGPFHSQSPEAAFAHTPGLKVVAPATAYDAKGLLKAAIRDGDPVVFLEHKFLYRRVRDRIPREDYVVPLGKAAVRRPGRDLTILTWSAMLWTALDAARELAKDGIEAEVVDVRTLLPLDEETILGSVTRTSRCLILHEDTRTGGVGAEIAATVAEKAFEFLDAPVVRVTAPDTPVPYAPELEEAFLPNTRTLLAAARRLAGY
jgi:2-oxoisovalerate dehydrogenase E1 component beta subunit